MLRYLLGTKIVIYVLKRRPLELLSTFNANASRIAISSITHKRSGTPSLGSFALPPEPDIKKPGQLCRMHRFVAGMQVAVVVYVECPATDLVIVIVMDPHVMLY